MNKKDEQLGMPHGTAQGKLRKLILFYLIKKLNLNICYRCNKQIETENELSIEHKEPYLDTDNPVELFFDINNIAFSHLKCNVNAARPKKMKHPSQRAYSKGCRCDGCKNEHRKNNSKWRNSKKIAV